MFVSKETIFYYSKYSFNFWIIIQAGVILSMCLEF